MMKKILFVVAALLAVVSCGTRSQELVILHVNDTHSHFEPFNSINNNGVGGVIEIAAYVDSVRAARGEDNVLLLHAGDFSQGSSYFTELKGNLEVDFLNALRFDATAIGNHEFDNGVDDLARRIKNINCPVVCANYDFSESALEDLIKPFTVIERASKKIGVIGLVTNLNSMVKDFPASILMLDATEVTLKWAKYLKEDLGCDFVVVLSHMGFKEDCQLVPTVRNIDLVIGGHSHTFIDAPEEPVDLDGKTVPVVQDGCWGEYVGKMTVTF